MQEGPSQSAFAVAVLRAQHQMVDGASIFRDPFAIPITGLSADAIAQAARDFPSFPLLRQFVAARSRFAEDSVARAVDRGVRQVVVLGAGLDTFGLRNPHTDKGVRVFEVDHAVTQLWKRRYLDKANLAIPPSLSFVAVDFETDSFLARLASADFKAREPAFFIWLGVLSYLSAKAVTATLSAIATIPDAEVVFDYGEPLDAIPPEHRDRYKTMIDRMEGVGEPWLSFFLPPELAALLSGLGFSEIEDLGPREVAARYRVQGQPAGGHIVRARKSSP